MKMSIDIPDSLYKQARIRAVETGQTINHLVLISLCRELEFPTATAKAGKSFLARLV